MVCDEFTSTANVTAARNIIMVKGHKKDDVDEAVFHRKRTAPVMSRPPPASKVQKVHVDREKLKAAAAKLKAKQEAALIRVKEKMRLEKEERKRREEKSAERGRCAKERRDERQVKKRREAEPRKEEAKEKRTEPEDDEKTDAVAPDHEKMTTTEEDKKVDRKVKRKIMVEVEDEDNEDGLTITIPTRALAPRTPKRKTGLILRTPSVVTKAREHGIRVFRSQCENNPVAYCFKCNSPVGQREPNHSNRQHKADNTNVSKLQTINNCIYNKSARGRRGPFHEKDILQPLLDLGVKEDAARSYLSGLQRNIGFSVSSEEEKCVLWLPPEFCNDDFPGLGYDRVVERQLQSNIIGKKILDEVDSEVE